MVWVLVLLADFVLEFRFEYLWPFWLFIRSVYDSFRYQGLVRAAFFFMSLSLAHHLTVPVTHLCFAQQVISKDSLCAPHAYSTETLKRDIDCNNNIIHERLNVFGEKICTIIYVQKNVQPYIS